MATIALKEGDFGSAEAVTVGETALYLPDRARPGLNEMVPLAAIAEIEDRGDDRSGQVKEAARLGMRGLLATANPLGLVAGVLAVGKVKDVAFSVRLKDGRGFTALADAVTLANLRAACRKALANGGEDAEAEARAEAVIAKYVGTGALQPDPLPMPERPAQNGEAAPAAQPQASVEPPARAVFGRRGVR